MESLIVLEDSIGPSGYPDWLTTGSDALGAFEAKPFMDFAFEELEKSRRDQHPTGTRFRVIRT